MELWIRSQDKKLLYKPSNLEIYDGGNKSNNHFFIKDCGDYLGEYETEERALEVLDEIQNIIIGRFAVNLDFKGAFSKNFTQEEAELTLKKIAVYEMPKE